MITSIYTIALAVLYIVLSARVIFTRRGERIAYGDNGSPRVQARIRAFGNLAEYAPMGLLLMFFAEMQGLWPIWLHICGLTFTIGRYLHGLGMAFRPKVFLFRTTGMLLTFVGLLIGIALNAVPLF